MRVPGRLVPTLPTSTDKGPVRSNGALSAAAWPSLHEAWTAEWGVFAIFDKISTYACLIAYFVYFLLYRNLREDSRSKDPGPITMSFEKAAVRTDAYHLRTRALTRTANVEQVRAFPLALRATNDIDSMLLACFVCTLLIRFPL